MSPEHSAVYSPRNQRLVADLAHTLSRRETKQNKSNSVVLIVGAGVDRGIGGRLLWKELIQYLAGDFIPATLCEALGAQAGQWPVEVAEALKTTLGPLAFDAALRKFIGEGGFRPNEPWARAMQAITASGVRTIVNLNYTADVEHLVRSSCPEFQVRTFDRAHLVSLLTRDILDPPDKMIHIVHLHGRIDPQANRSNDVVLDQRSYDVSLGSRHYIEFFRRLLHEFSVITIGVSWADPALRTLAAQVRSETPVSGRIHVAMLDRTPYPEQLWWVDRALVSSFGVYPIFYSPADGYRAGPELLERIGRGNPRCEVREPLEHHLGSIADFLDGCGDHESAAQSDWMAVHWRSLMEAFDRQSTSGLTADRWVHLARIERHLRHFLWFYLPPALRSERRTAIWERVAALYHALSEDDQKDLWRPEWLARTCGSQGALSPSDSRQRGVLEFAFGVYEVRYLASTTTSSPHRLNWRMRLERAADAAPESIMAQRIRLAARLWGTAPRPEALRELRRAAVACRWEGVEAKIALDEVQSEFMGRKNRHRALARNWPEADRQCILAMAEDAHGIARAAGAFRREVGALVTASFAQPPAVAEARLLAVRERFLESRGRGYETSTLWWIYVGLLATDFDSHLSWGARATPYDSMRALRYLQSRCSDLELRPPEDVAVAVADNALPHWGRYHEPAAELIRQILANGAGAEPSHGKMVR